MAKRKNVIPKKYSSAGYCAWPVRRLIREAENVARWNPWLAHAWMEEAKDQLSLDLPLFSEYEEAVDRINARWKLLETLHWFDSVEFWSYEGQPCSPKYLDYL